MISEKSIRLLSEIGLLDIASIVEMQQEMELYTSMSFSERMDHLISELYQRKMDAKYKGLMSRAHLRYRNAAIEDIVYRNRGFSKDDIAGISDPSFIKKGHNLILRGPVGSGKTYLACAIANTVGIFRTEASGFCTFGVLNSLRISAISNHWCSESTSSVSPGSKFLFLTNG